MPFRKNYRKNAPKRKFRRKKRAPVKKNPLALYKVPFPTTRKVKFRYREYGNFSTGVADTASTYSFNLNSIYDPNQTGVGDQPRYFDQLMGADKYLRYRVDAVTYRVTFINKGDSGQGDSQVAIKFANNSTFPGSANSEGIYLLRELNRVRHAMILPAGQDKCRKTFTGTVHLHLLAQSTLAQYRSDHDCQANWNTSPVQGIFMLMYGVDNPQDASTHDIDWFVDLTYHTTVWGLTNAVTQS